LEKEALNAVLMLTGWFGLAEGLGICPLRKGLWLDGCLELNPEGWDRSVKAAAP
jgi:hypothetical protein